MVIGKSLSNDPINQGEGVNDTVNEGDTKGGAKGGAKEIDGTHLDLLDLLRESPNLSRSDIAQRLNLGKTTVYRHLKWLKDNDYIVRQGGKKAGYWEVLG